MRKRFSILVFLSFLLIVPIAANADLIGNSVFGTLTFGGFVATNYWDPLNGFVPGIAGPQPLATVGSTVEFIFQSSNDQLSADFDGSSLTVAQHWFTSAPANSWEMTFVDQSQDFSGLTLVSNSFPGLTWSLASGTITLDFPGGSSFDWSATFSVEAVPLPPSALLLGSGLLGLVGLRRFRKS